MPNSQPDTDDARSEAERALQQSKEQTRHSADQPASSSTGTTTLDEAVADAYRALDAGERHENLTVRDENLAALVAALEATERLDDVGERANAYLDREGDVETRAGLLKALLRIGLSEVAADELDAAKTGRTRYIQQKESETGF